MNGGSSLDVLGGPDYDLDRGHQQAKRVLHGSSRKGNSPFAVKDRPAAGEMPPAEQSGYKEVTRR